MRAIVTGGTGFVGNRLVLELVRSGWDVICVTRRPVASRFEKIECRVVELDELGDASLPGRVDCVFHLAAALDGADASRYLHVNGAGTAAMLELAEACGAEAFIYTSTQLVIGRPEAVPFGVDHPTRPETPYAVGKLAGEMACEMFRRSGRVATTSLRLTAVVGEGMPCGSVLPRFVARALSSEDLAYHGTGARVQNFVHVDDVVRACVGAAKRPGGGIMNVGGDSLSMRDLAELVVRSTPGSGSRVLASGAVDAQEDYRWVPTIDYEPSHRMETFLPEYVESIRRGTALERWWMER